MPGFLKIPNTLFLLMFAAAVYVQHNDPDPVGWMAIYGTAALSCLLAFTPLRTRILPMLTTVAAGVWAYRLYPDVWGKVGIGDLFKEIDMKTPEIELGREFGGLLIIAFWMLVLVLFLRTKKKPA